MHVYVILITTIYPNLTQIVGIDTEQLFTIVIIIII